MKINPKFLSLFLLALIFVTCGSESAGEPSGKKRRRTLRDEMYELMTDEEREAAMERMWDGQFQREGQEAEEEVKVASGQGQREEQAEDFESLMDPERVVQAIRMRFATPDVIQVVDPPNLAGQGPDSEGPEGSPAPRRLKLVIGQQHSVTPVEPITNLLNKRKEPEIPDEEDGEEVGTTVEESHAALMFKQALELLGISAARDSTGYHVITSVGKTEKVEQAYSLLQQAAHRGHKRAMELVAWGQLLGPLPLDIDDAKRKFEFLAGKGYPNSQMAMGFLHANALDAELNGALPILYYTFSSIAGASWSQMALGYRYWGGIGVPVSCEKALEQYRRVAATVASEVSEVGTGPAIQRIRLLDEIEGAGSTSSSSSTGNILNSDILDYYTMLAERGDLQAQVGLGQLHFQGGRGISPDHHLALRYFRRAADAGSPVAMAFLGKMYLEGNDAVEPDTAQALKWFQRAAEQGSPVGQSGLGLMYLTGKGLPKDPSQALKYFTMAAEQGWVDGQLHLGNMYMAGIGVRRDYQQASKYYNLAAQSGHILAIYNLAQMHATGTGMIRSCSAAVELYKTVAERGRWGLLLAEAHNDYKEKRFSQALVKYLLLSELGYEAAQSNAGFLLERGEVGYEVFEAWRKLGEKKVKVPESEDATLTKPSEPAAESSPEIQAEGTGQEEDTKPSSEDQDQPEAAAEPEEKPIPAQEKSAPDMNKSEHSEGDWKFDFTSAQSMLSRALQQWARAASQGYSQARVRLGDFYYYGWGTQTDYSSAAMQYRLASEQQRNPQAMFNLAYMHEQGLGLKQDLHLAKRFYDMAAETSQDAKVPVTLALIKLNFMSTLHTLKLFDFGTSVGSDPAPVPQPPPEQLRTGLGQHQHHQQQEDPPSEFDQFGDASTLVDTLDFSNNWDLYLLTVLVGVLGLLVWLRRPQPPIIAGG